MTFDDHNVSNWVSALPLFEKYGAHVTFFIDRWDQLSSEDIAGLRQLKSAGHAIGCHGLRHIKAVDYSNEYSVEKYMAEEVMPAVRLMRKAGFNPTCFAYPFSNRNIEVDDAQLKIFRHLRSGCGSAGKTLVEIDSIFVPINEIAGRGCLIGTSVQPHAVDDNIIKEVGDAFQRAKAKNEIVLFYAHDIRAVKAPGAYHYITPDGLETVLRSAISEGLQFYTFDNLP